MKVVCLVIALGSPSPVFAAQQILGEYSTVNISDCASVIHFLENGKGIFTDYCDGGNPDGNNFEFSWYMEDSAIHANINGNNETFRLQDKLTCSYIGKKGSAIGLIGMDLYFWKKPVNCK